MPSFETRVEIAGSFSTVGGTGNTGGGGTGGGTGLTAEQTTALNLDIREAPHLIISVSAIDSTNRADATAFDTANGTSATAGIINANPIVRVDGSDLRSSSQINNGFLVRNLDDNNFYRWNGTAWIQQTSNTGSVETGVFREMISDDNLYMLLYLIQDNSAYFVRNLDTGEEAYKIANTGYADKTAFWNDRENLIYETLDTTRRIL